MWKYVCAQSTEALTTIKVIYCISNYEIKYSKILTLFFVFRIKNQNSNLQVRLQLHRL